MLISILTRIVIGATLGAVVGAIVTGDWIYTIVWAIGLPVFIMMGLIGGLSSRRVPGELGFSMARVETVERTGANVNGTQAVDVRLTVVGDIAYTTTAGASLTDDDLRTIRPGSIVAVELVGANRPDARIITSPTPAIEEQLARARNDPSLIPAASSVPAWETATTTTPGTLKPGTRKRGGPASLVITIAIILVSAAVVLIPAYPSIARGVNNIATGNFGASDMVTGLYAQDAVDEMIAVAGTSQFTSLGFYPDYVLGDALSQTSDGHTDAITWRYGRAFVEGPSFSQSNELEEELFDASALDISLVSKLANQTVDELRLENVENVYAYVQNDLDGNGPEITISVSGEYDDASVTYTFDGEVVRRGGSAFDE